MQRMSRIGEYVARIAEKNAALNAIIAHYDVSERAAAAPPADADNAPLVWLLKDNMCTKQLPTTCGSRILKDFVSPYDATLVTHIKDAGDVIVGKTNMDEFAMGTDNVYSVFGPVQNALFPGQNRSPGGSSGGSATAVSAGLCDVALGSDTGGSIRLPASFCSVFGFKPSYGRISRFGVISYAQSLDTVGLFTRSLPMLRRAFSVIDHHDPLDGTSVTDDMRAKFPRALPDRPLRIGVAHEAIVDMDPAIRAKWVECLQALIDRGHEIVEVSVPSLRLALPTYFTLSPAEASSNLARYDGIRYGQRASADMDDINEILYGPTRSLGFGDEVQRRLLLGTFNLTAEAYDEHFLKAQKVRRLVIDDFNRVFTRENPLFPSKPKAEGELTVDVFVNPTSPNVAGSIIKDNSENNVEDLLGDVLTIPANLAGLPAISVPVGPSMGMEAWAQYGDDEMVLGVAEMIDDIFKYPAGAVNAPK